MGFEKKLSLTWAVTGLMGLRVPWNGSPSSCWGPGVKPARKVTDQCMHRQYCVAGSIVTTILFLWEALPPWLTASPLPLSSHSAHVDLRILVGVSIFPPKLSPLSFSELRPLWETTFLGRNLARFTTSSTVKAESSAQFYSIPDCEQVISKAASLGRPGKGEQPAVYGGSRMAET
jgi:hypothetical protein